MGKVRNAVVQRHDSLSIAKEVLTMDNEKDKDAATAAGNGETGDTASRRAWSKPAITRIEMKRTLGGLGSLADGGPFTSSP